MEAAMEVVIEALMDACDVVVVLYDYFKASVNERIAHCLMDMPDDAVFRIHYNGVLIFHPLRYESGRVIEMQAYTIDRVMFSHMCDMLVAKIKENIWALSCHIPG
nr:transposase, MuDR, MULE transposase domain protein [Tanacetum cinerariifolium]